MEHLLTIVQRCESGVCVSSVFSCPLVTELCTLGALPFDCNSTCIKTPALCPPSQSCAANNLTACWDGSCNDALSCPAIPECPITFVRFDLLRYQIISYLTTFRCPDGSCTLDPSLCPPTPQCSLQGTSLVLHELIEWIVCADGTCMSSLSDCIPFDGCPAATPFSVSNIESAVKLM